MRSVRCLSILSAGVFSSGGSKRFNRYEARFHTATTCYNGIDDRLMILCLFIIVPILRWKDVLYHVASDSSYVVQHTPNN